MEGETRLGAGAPMHGRGRQCHQNQSAPELELWRGGRPRPPTPDERVRGAGLELKPRARARRLEPNARSPKPRARRLLLLYCAERMGSLFFFAFSWWAILLRVVAIVHFIRRRPNFYWLWIILMHWMGALVYIAVEVVPDAGLLRQSFQVFPRRRRIRELEAIVLDNPSAGNQEAIAQLYLEE